MCIIKTIEETIALEQGCQVCDELVITAGKNVVITGSSQITSIVANCPIPSRAQKSVKTCTDSMIYLFCAIVRPLQHNLSWCNTLYM